MSTLKPVAENSLCQLFSLSKSSDVSVLFSCFSRRFFPQDVFQICRFMISFSTVKTIALSKLSYQRRRRLDLHDQNPKISLLLSGLGLRKSNFLQNASFYKQSIAIRSKNRQTKNKNPRRPELKYNMQDAIFKLSITLLNSS